MTQVLDVEKIRKEFPLLSRTIKGKALCYFDNGATTQKPLSVIERLKNYYDKENSNIHRGVHQLSQEATSAFEQARESVRSFIHASHVHEIIITKGTTESINLVAASYAKRFLHAGDNVIISAMEHHANIVPWQMVCETYGAELRVIPIDKKGELQLDRYTSLLDNKTRMVAITHVSNVLGTINPIEKIIQMAHALDVPVLLDGAQGIAHAAVDVKALDCDFYCFSGHKMYAPMGVGVLYGKEFWLEQMPPYQGGGEMIKEVSFQKTTYNELPFKFEAGTPSVADVLGLETAISYIQSIGIENIAQYEHELLQYATQGLNTIPDIRIFGQAKEKAAVLSFLIGNIHPFDAGTILDHLGIAIRTGHHCAQPLIQLLEIPGTMRASFSIYNTKEEIDRLLEAIEQVRKMFS